MCNRIKKGGHPCQSHSKDLIGAWFAARKTMGLVDRLTGPACGRGVDAVVNS